MVFDASLALDLDMFLTAYISEPGAKTGVWDGKYGVAIHSSHRISIRPSSYDCMSLHCFFLRESMGRTFLLKAVMHVMYYCIIWVMAMEGVAD